jgi:Na+/H+-translocating membrane pyrophosphatase
VIAIAFLIGAFFSAFAGWIGMNIATKANVRTTQAARTSLAKGLKVSFNGGTVMGLGVAVWPWSASARSSSYSLACTWATAGNRTASR